MEPQEAVVKTADGRVTVVDADVVARMKLIAEMMEDQGATEVIPLPNVSDVQLLTQMIALIKVVPDWEPSGVPPITQPLVFADLGRIGVPDEVVAVLNEVPDLVELLNALNFVSATIALPYALAALAVRLMRTKTMKEKLELLHEPEFIIDDAGNKVKNWLQVDER